MSGNHADTNWIEDPPNALYDEIDRLKAAVEALTVERDESQAIVKAAQEWAELEKQWAGRDWTIPDTGLRVKLGGAHAALLAAVADLKEGEG
jgi:hypothetical protein